MEEDLIKGERYIVTSKANYNSFNIGDTVVAIESGIRVECVYEKDWDDEWQCADTTSYFANKMNPRVVEPVQKITTFKMMAIAKYSGKTYVCKPEHIKYNVMSGFISDDTNKPAVLHTVLNKVMDYTWYEEDVKSEEPEEVTIQEIEERLGHKIKIVKESEYEV